MDLYKRPESPVWFASWTNPVTGVRTRRSTRQRDKRLAAKVAQGWLEADLDAPRKGKPTLTVAQAIDRYVRHLEAAGKASAGEQRRMSVKTIHGHRSGRWEVPEGLMLHDLTPALLADLVAARQAEGNGPQTIAHELKLLRASTRHAAELGFEVSGIRNWRLPAVKPKMRYLSPAEWERLFRQMDPEAPVTMRSHHTGRTVRYAPRPTLVTQKRDAQDLMVALTLTGGRWSEVSKLTWEQVDTAGWQTIRLWGSKTSQERIVGIPSQIAGVLKRRHAERSGSTLVFPGVDGRRRSGSSKAILRAMDAAGLNDPDTVATYGRATIHSLRHTYASWLLQRGADLAEVQQLLGHSTLQMTRRYAHLGRKATAAKAARLLDEPAEVAP